MISSNNGTLTELYLVRIWKRTLGDGTLDLHGKLQHVVSGEARYFRSCPQLMDTLLEMMQGHQEHGKDQDGPSGSQPQQGIKQHAETTS